MFDFDTAYSNSDFIPDSQNWFTRWADESAVYRQTHREHLDLKWGKGIRHKYDLFQPTMEAEEKIKGTVIFFHGGYWMKLDHRQFAHLSVGCLKQNWAVAMPSYDLCPNVSIDEIVQQAARAVKMIATESEGPLVLSGHSAGGHIVASLITEKSPLASNDLSRILRVVGISGLYDLRPLVNTKMNDVFGLDYQSAKSVSPALQMPQLGPDFVAWVGEKERPAFVQQNALLANIWSLQGFPVREIIAKNHHHFSILEDMKNEYSDLVSALTLTN